MDDTQAWFEEQVVAALDGLPDEFKSRLENLEVMVAAEPSPHQLRVSGIGPGYTLYGLYEGIPLTGRTTNYGLVVPDVITIFSGPLLRDFPDPDRLSAQIHHTVLHELAHHFGISDQRLHELGAY